MICIWTIIEEIDHSVPHRGQESTDDRQAALEKKIKKKMQEPPTFEAFYKVQVFWEGHKHLELSSTYFWQYSSI